MQAMMTGRSPKPIPWCLLQGRLPLQEQTSPSISQAAAQLEGHVSARMHIEGRPDLLAERCLL